ARVALRHDDEIGIEFVLHVDGGAVARDGLLERHHFDAGALRLPFAFDRLVVDADAGDARVDAVPHEAPHGRDAAVPRVAVDDDREIDALRDPPGDLHAFGHGRGADVGETRISADDTARAH